MHNNCFRKSNTEKKTHTKHKQNIKEHKIMIIYMTHMFIEGEKKETRNMATRQNNNNDNI